VHPGATAIIIIIIAIIIIIIIVASRTERERGWWGESRLRELTRWRAGPLWLDVRRPVRDEGRDDLALRRGLVQKPVVVPIALRYA